MGDGYSVAWRVLDAQFVHYGAEAFLHEYLNARRVGLLDEIIHPVHARLNLVFAVPCFCPDNDLPWQQHGGGE